MKTKFIHYSHYSQEYLPNYFEYLSTYRYGNIFSWSMIAFILHSFWLVYHKMYKENAIFIFFLMYPIILYHKQQVSLPIFFILMFLPFLLLGFCFKFLYKKRVDDIIYYYPDRVSEKLKPNNLIITILIFFIYNLFLFILNIQILLFIMR